MMPDLALLLLGLAWAYFGKNQGSTALQPQPIGPGPDPYPYMPPEQLPAGLPVSYTPPWPQATPKDLPPFPGAGWEPDEPPPAAVKNRAWALLEQLWGKGKGAYRIEQTAGRWIAYRAEIMASGKKGVVAYRQKKAGAAPRPAAPAAGRPVLTSTSPGMPQPAQSVPNAGRTATIQRGHWYQWTTRIAPGGSGVTAIDISKELVASGAVNVVVSREAPHLCVYVQQSSVNHRMAIGQTVAATVGGKPVQITLLDVKEVREVKPPDAPGEVSVPLPPGYVQTSAPAPAPASGAPLGLPTLRHGMGAKPAAPNADVRLLQQRLGITADGRFWDATRDAVKAFQRQKRLTPDGVVGPQTWAALYARA